jgi:hypothetical protein
VTTEEAVAALIKTLNELEVPYMIVGSYSSNFYGLARSTKDADVVVNLPNDISIGIIAKKLGPAFRLNPQGGFETVTATPKYVVTLVDIPFTIEIFLLSGDEHDQERFRRRRQVQMMGCATFIPAPEDVIVMKLRWAASRGKGQGKDWSDVANVIAISGDVIDWPYVYSWCDKHGTRELLDSIRASIPPL